MNKTMIQLQEEYYSKTTFKFLDKLFESNQSYTPDQIRDIYTGKLPSEYLDLIVDILQASDYFKK